MKLEHCFFNDTGYGSAKFIVGGSVMEYKLSMDEIYVLMEALGSIYGKALRKFEKDVKSELLEPTDITSKPLELEDLPF